MQRDERKKKQQPNQCFVSNMLRFMTPMMDLVLIMMTTGEPCRYT